MSLLDGSDWYGNSHYARHKQITTLSLRITIGLRLAGGEISAHVSRSLSVVNMRFDCLRQVTLGIAGSSLPKSYKLIEARGKMHWSYSLSNEK